MFQAVQCLLYVEDPAKSAAFYADLLGKPAKTLSPFFAVVTLQDGVELAFWARAKAPAQWNSTGESGELCLIVKDEAALRDLHAGWAGKGVTVLQAPEKMYFGGFNCVVEDLDGHRIRLSTPDR